MTTPEPSSRMSHKKAELAQLLRGVDLGNSVAESDHVLQFQEARVETSAFTDLLEDRVDLVPGAKGSGKSALYRIFVDFLPDYLLQNRKGGCRARCPLARRRRLPSLQRPVREAERGRLRRLLVHLPGVPRPRALHQGAEVCESPR